MPTDERPTKTPLWLPAVAIGGALLLVAIVVLLAASTSDEEEARTDPPIPSGR